MPRNTASEFLNIRYVFLDREGVINRKPPDGQYVTSWRHFELLPGAEKAIALLHDSGRKVILVTNQRCVALGLCSEADVQRIHHQLRTRFEQHGGSLDGVYFCPHDDGQCDCRKPKTGMFEQAFRDFPDARPEIGVMIGDSLSDIEAGIRMGMKTVLIETEVARGKTEDGRAAKLATVTAGSLLEAVEQCFGLPVPRNS
jgi:histidinol-phosphate phosphatase family protein